MDRWRDCRQALRVLLVRPGFSVLAMLSLALGLGAALAILSVVDAVLVRALPYPDAQRLVALRELDENGKSMPFADANFRDLRERLHGFAALAQYGGGTDLVVSGNRSTRGDVRIVSGDFFDALGVEPALGRRFAADVAPGDAHVAVVSHALWRELLGGDADLSHLHIDVSGESLQVVGVMPPQFDFPAKTGVWFPRALFPPEASRTAHNWSAVGRLRAGADLEQMRADALALGRDLKRQYGKDVDAVAFSLTPLRDLIVGPVRNALWALAAGVAFLLVIAFVNVTNLFLALALTRRKETAVREALGAARARLARQSMLESILLTTAAFGLAVLFAQACLHALVDLAGTSLPRAGEIGFDARVAGALAILSAAFALLVGLLPHWRGGDAAALTGEGRSMTLGRHAVRVRSALLVAQTALTVLLLVGAGLLGRSFLHLLSIDPGFRPDGAVALDVSASAPNDAAGRELALRYAALMQRFAALPGVRAVGGVNALPLTDTGWNGAFWDGVAVPKLDDLVHLPKPLGYAEYRVASAGYPAAIGMPLLRGRGFDDRDGADAPHVALISATLARGVWPDRDPIGQTIQYGNMDGDMRLLTIVGVVGDVRDAGLDRDVRGTVYVNLAQRPKAAANFSIVVRGDLAPDALIAALRSELARSEPDLPAAFHSLTQVYATSLDHRRFSLSLFGLFAAVALGLALSGAYGLMAYVVGERRAEFSLRLALGSTPGRVLCFVLVQGLRLMLVGLALGCIAALFATRLMQSLLFELNAADPLTYAVVALLLLAASLAACAVPAWRAARTDPRAFLA